MAKKSIYYTRESFVRDKKRSHGNYYGSHYKSIKKSRLIQFNRLKNGFIVKMNYNSKLYGTTKTAIYLVIEPDYTPPRFMINKLPPKGSKNRTVTTKSGRLMTEVAHRYMHVFDLSYVPPAQVRKLVEFTKNVRISNFIFGNSKYGFLDFRYNKRALYDSLVPVMRDSYRTLIRDKVHIRSVELIDYDFKEKAGAPTIQFIRPNLNNPQLKLELRKIASELGIDIKKLMNALPSGNMIKFDLNLWEDLNRTESSMGKGAEWFYKMSAAFLDENYKATPEVVAKEVEDMIPKLFKDQRKYAPIVLNFENQHYLVYGEKLMQVCRVLAIIPTVYMIKV